MNLLLPLFEKFILSTGNSAPSTEASETRSALPSPPMFTSGHAVPEILQEIFLYLSQQDLVQKTSQVNQLWRSISMLYIRDKVTWRDTMTPEDQKQALLGVGLEGTKVLQLWAQDSRVYPAYEDGIEQLVDAAWEALADAIRLTTTVHEGDEAKMRPRWQTLIFSGDIKWLALQLEPWILQGSLESISTLHLSHLTPGPVDLSSILSELPNLTELTIESMEGRPFATRQNVTITWETQTVQEGGEGDNDWTLVLPKLNIRTLSLRSILVNQWIMETILRSMPRLRSLELISVLQPADSFHEEKYPAGKRDKNDFDLQHYIHRVRLLQFLVRYCPCLAHFHLSVNTSWWKLSQEDMVQIASGFPDLRSFSCMTKDIELETLPLFVDRLTTLELTTNGQSNIVRRGLHWYLCHAPLLLHLKASGVLAFSDNLILDPTWKLDGPSRISSYSSRPIPPVETWDFEGRVWACRDLRTIDMCVETQRLLHYTVRRHSDVVDELGSSNNRRLFAYLSLVCPKLEEITLQGPQLEISVQSGLVLLSRLERLRRLRLYVSLTPWFEKGSLDWMRIGWGVWPPPPPFPTATTWAPTQFHYPTKRCSPDISVTRQLPWVGPILGWYEERRRVREKSSYQVSILKSLESNAEVLEHKAKTLTFPSYYPDRSTLVDFMKSREQHTNSPWNDSEPSPLHPVELVTMEALEHVAGRFQELSTLQRQNIEGKSEKRIWPNLDSFEVLSGRRLCSQAMRCILQMRPDLQAWDDVVT